MRYSRQVLFAPIGPAGQERLRQSRVLIVGCGALGSVSAEILARSGVGRLTLADRDYVDESNLQRQSLYTEADAAAALPKAVAASRRIGDINREVDLFPEVVDVDPASIERLVDGQDLILDGTDNFETRYLLNDASLRWNIPWIYGACVGSYGLACAFVPGETPCLRCLLERMPGPGSSPTCDTAGVIGPIVHLVSALQTAEALKLLSGDRTALDRRLVTVDLWQNRISTLDLGDVAPSGECPACGERRFEFLDGACTSASLLCGRNAVQIRSGSAVADFAPLAARLGRVGDVRFNDFLLRAEIAGFEIALFRDGRSIIRGTRDEDEARRVYGRYIGN